MSITSIMRGVSGEFEVGRTLLSGAGASAIVSPIGFQTFDMVAHGAHFDVAAWCVAYPAGLAALVAGGVLGIGNKDKNVAVAKQTQAATDAATNTDSGSTA